MCCQGTHGHVRSRDFPPPSALPGAVPHHTGRAGKGPTSTMLRAAALSLLIIPSFLRYTTAVHASDNEYGQNTVQSWGNFGGTFEGENIEDNAQDNIEDEHPSFDLHRRALEAHNSNDNALARDLVHSAIQTYLVGDKIEKAPATANLFNTLGVIHKANGDMQGALNAWATSIELHEDTWGAWYNIAIVCHYRPSDVADMTIDGMVIRDPQELALAFYDKAHSTIDVRDPEQTLPDTYLTFLQDYALLLSGTGRQEAAVSVLETACALYPTDLSARGNLVIQYRDLRNTEAARRHSEIAISHHPNVAALYHNYGLVLQDQDDHSGAVSQFKQAVAVDPSTVDSWNSLGHESGSAGDLASARSYYASAVEHGGGVASELMMATAVIPHIYESLGHIDAVRRSFEEALVPFLTENRNISDPRVTTGSAALGYYIIYQGYRDIHLRRLHAQVYMNLAPSLIQPFLLPPPPRDTESASTAKIRVGFHSSFFYRHSVGLLLQNTICRVDRSTFDVFVFIQTPPPEVDDVYSTITSCADTLIHLPSNLEESRKIIQSTPLDALVYSEVGMDTWGYFLPFTQNAPVTALFWGHAVTSGISQADLAVYGGTGGIDYYVTSELFERPDVPSESIYSETPYLMKGMVSSFPRPLPAEPGMTLASFDLPPDQNIYLCPQTLYKLHPSFDLLIVSILMKDPRALIVFPVAQRSEWTVSLMQRLDNVVPDDGDNSLKTRIRFVRRTSFSEFIALASLANVILDPFPVGGGRSSFEIFSVGSPVVMHYERTVILQLTYGMYRTMGIDYPIAYTDTEYVEKAVAIGTNRTLEDELRSSILQKNYLLYDNDDVVNEWNEFLKHIVSFPRPVKTYVVPDYHLEGAHESLELSASELGYAIRLQHVDPTTYERQTLTLRLAAHDDPVEYADAASKAVNAEPVKSRWIKAVLVHGMARLSTPIVFSFSASIRSQIVTFDVHEGDDLDQAAVYYSLRHGLNHFGTTWLSHTFQRNVPQHDKPEWRAMRRTWDNIPTPPAVPTPSALSSCYLTVALTTCRRIDLFIKTADSFLASISEDDFYQHVCEIVVVDDSSSDEDRRIMAKRYPAFRFVHKRPEEKGHAKSLNVIKSLTKTRWLMYLEDDWLFNDRANFTSIIADPMSVLLDQGSNVGQVLLNDQSSRPCAYAMEECDTSNLGTAGWRRETADGVIYVEHEFGVVGEAFGFSYWPGFSLNPAIWDLRRIESALGEGWAFDDADTRFEQSFSMGAMDAGLTTAHMPNVILRHIGVEVSSYVLNDEKRPFDKP